MIDKKTIDVNVMQLLNALRVEGYTAYLVGGSVRDLLLGQQPKDFDIVTNATPYQIKRVIPEGKIIGKRFRHVLLEKKRSRYEIVTFRASVAEKKTMISAKKTRYPDLNQFGNAQEDAFRRDFTINALFYDPFAEELIDYVKGKEDINKKSLRTIGDPMERLKDDPIRILRAIRHKTKLGLSYSPELKSAITKTGPELQETSRDRVREEFFKVCMDRTIGKFLMEAKDLSLLPYLAPWFKHSSEKTWKEALLLWNAFHAAKTLDSSFVIGISIMMAPIAEQVVLEEYKKEQERKQSYPDMRFFINSKVMRTWLIHNLRISKLQTDIIMRACFYSSQMLGSWMKEGAVPKKIEAKIHQQNGAKVGALIAKLFLQARGKECSSWILDILEKHSSARNSSLRGERKSFKRYPEAQNVRLPILSKPLSWNGPLHAPVLRPTFNDENSIQKDSSSLAYRISGIPLPPENKSLLYAEVAKSYKPEFPESAEEEHLEKDKKETYRKESRSFPPEDLLEDNIGNRIEDSPTHTQGRERYYLNTEYRKSVLTKHEEQLQKKSRHMGWAKRRNPRSKKHGPPSRKTKPRGSYHGRKPRNET